MISIIFKCFIVYVLVLKNIRILPQEDSIFWPAMCSAIPFLTAQSLLQLLNFFFQQAESRWGPILSLHVRHTRLQLFQLGGEGDSEVKNWFCKKLIWLCVCGCVCMCRHWLSEYLSLKSALVHFQVVSRWTLLHQLWAKLVHLRGGREVGEKNEEVSTPVAR